jgi:hypothetical protein
LNIEDDALSMIRQYAEERGISIGQAASDLVHRGAESLPSFKTKNGRSVFDLPAGTPVLTNETLTSGRKQSTKRSIGARFLLDVNVLVVLPFPLHSAHQSAHARFQREPDRQWAACPLRKPDSCASRAAHLGRIP